MPKSISVKISTMEADLEFSIIPTTLGRVLFEQVNKTINIQEFWWFGLQFEDSKGFTQWLKLKEKISTQDIVGMKESGVANLKYRAIYFPEDSAAELIQMVTIKMIFLQVKDAILRDEIYCPADASVLLASYAAQAKYEDYQDGLEKYLLMNSQLCKRITDQHTISDEEWVNKIVVWWKEHSGMLKEDAMIEYLKIAQDLEMYGVNYYEIKNNKGTELYLGVDALGLNVYEKSNKLTPKIGFPWSEIKNVSFKEKKFLIKSVDRKAPDFVFLTSRAKINKQIVTLCIGNHELYSRRRKEDTIDILQLKAHAEEEKKFKLLEKERLNREKRSREAAENRLREMEEKFMNQLSENEKTQKSLEDYEFRMKEITSRLEIETQNRKELEEMHARLEENHKILMESKNITSQEYALLQSDHEKIIQEIEAKEKAMSESNIQLASYQSQMAELVRERETLAQKALLLENIQIKCASSMLDNELDEFEENGNKRDSYEHDLSVGIISAGDRNEENRSTQLDKNNELQKKLNQLSKDLKAERDSSRMNTSDIEHEENCRKGRDKFKTLKQIRQGNTKKRIDEFESM